MSIFELLSIVAAVVLGNAVSAAFAIAAIKSVRLQRDGATNDQLPLWVWIGMAFAPIVVFVGVSFTSAQG